MNEPIEMRWRFFVDPVADPLLYDWCHSLPPGRRRGAILASMLSRALSYQVSGAVVVPPPPSSKSDSARPTEPVEVRWRFTVDPLADLTLYQWCKDLPDGRRRGVILTKLLSVAVALQAGGIVVGGRNAGVTGLAASDAKSNADITDAVAKHVQEPRSVAPAVPVTAAITERPVNLPPPVEAATPTVDEVPSDVITDDIWETGLGDMLVAFEPKT